MPGPLTDDEISSIGRLVFFSGDSAAPDVALVFGSPHHGDLLADRAVSLWRNRKLKAIVFSGHNGEASRTADLAVGLGLPRASVILENWASNTRENIVNSIEHLSLTSANYSFVAVCKLYSACRTFLTIRKQLPEWSVEIAPVDWLGATPRDWSRSEPFVGKLCEEFARILEYQQSGDVASFASLDLSEIRFRYFLKRLREHRETLIGSFNDH